MGNPRLFPTATRAALIVPFIATLSACATGGVARSPAVSPADDEREAVADRGPRVQIWTRDETLAGDRISTSFRLEDDAYVVVVNVGRDGYVNVVFPESPEDDGFMRGGRTYRLPPFFPGFSRHTRSDYGRLYNATSSYDEVYDRYAGYVFVIASWRPMHFEISEALGLWDNYRLAAHEERLDPYVVMHRFADQLVPGRSRDYTARFARYSAFGRGFAGRSSFARCSAFGSAFGAYPAWAYYGLLAAGWVPIYGYSHFDLGGPNCGVGFGLTVVGFRPGARPGVTRPMRPTAPADTTVRPPARPTDRPPLPPAVASDSGERKPPPGRGRGRTEVALDEPIVDVTRETRAQLRREERALEQARRELSRERYEPSEGWRRTDDSRRAERVRAREHASDRGESERSRPTTNDDNARVRSERPREASRDNEPRRESSRSEPRSEPRSQPAPRSDPAPRSEPRGERPAKPPRE